MIFLSCRRPRAYLLVRRAPRRCTVHRRRGPFGIKRKERVIVMGTSANTIAPTRNQQQAAVQKMLSGVEKHTQDLVSLVIAGTTYSTADLQTTLQARLDALTSAQSKKAEWQAAINADYAERASTKVFL